MGGLMHKPAFFRRCLAGLILMGAGLSAAFAHHGWRWTDDGQFELTARVEKAVLGNPHGVLTMDADGAKWLVEVGQPWRNERAGLTDAMMAKGATLTVIGKRSADAEGAAVESRAHRHRWQELRSVSGAFAGWKEIARSHLGVLVSRGRTAGVLREARGQPRCR